MLVTLERVDAGHEKAALAVRPQPHVDFVEPSGRRMHGEQMHDALSKPQKEHHIVERAFAPGLLNLAARVVQEDEIEIGAVAEFQAAELAVTRHRHLHDASSRFLVAAVRNPVHLGHLLPGKIHAALDDQFRDIGQPVAHRHQRQASREVRERHREHGDLLELSQGFDLPLRIVRRQPLRTRGEFTGKSRARGRLLERFRIDQFVEQQRKIRDLARQETADGANLDQTVHGRGLVLSTARGRTSARRSHRGRAARARQRWPEIAALQPTSAGARG